MNLGFGFWPRYEKKENGGKIGLLLNLYECV
jgi:hypothetical protein